MINALNPRNNAVYYRDIVVYTKNCQKCYDL